MSHKFILCAISVPKIIKLVEIWQIYGKNNFAQFFETRCIMKCSTAYAQYMFVSYFASCPYYEKPVYIIGPSLALVSSFVKTNHYNPMTEMLTYALWLSALVTNTLFNKL